MEGKFEIKKVIGGKTFYAKVNLEVDVVREPFLEIEVPDYLKSWKSAIEFACQYVQNSVYRKSGSIRVAIKAMHTMDVDTTEIVVFYAVVSALCKGLAVACPVYIDESGSVVVPK